MTESLQDQLTRCYEARQFEQKQYEKHRTQLQSEIERLQVQIETQQAQIASLRVEIRQLSSGEPS